MFVSPETENEILRQLHALKAPGGAVALYDKAAMTLIMCVAKREQDDSDPQPISWVVWGPMTADQARQELHEAAMRDEAFAGIKPVTIN